MLCGMWYMVCWQRVLKEQKIGSKDNNEIINITGVNMEILDVVDEYGEPTGETVDRESAHAKGIRHRTSHVWVVRKNNGIYELLLQKRSADKDAYPGCLDVSSAGHIPAGCGYIESARRELNEELGIDAEDKEFIDCGIKPSRGIRRNIFHGKEFVDNQISRVFIVFKDVEAEDIACQKEELESVEWMTLDACMKMVERNSRPNCLDMNELKIIEEKLSE